MVFIFRLDTNNDTTNLQIFIKYVLRTPDGSFLGGNCPGGAYPGWEFSLVEVFRVGIVRWESSG